jgi:quercetin dioxygenase-like cupin family protein
LNIPHLRKNIDYAKILDLKNLVPYVEGKVVSQTLLEGDMINMSVYTIDKGEELSCQASTGETLAYVIKGKMNAKIWGDEYYLNEGEMINLPNNISHQLKAVDKLTVLLTTLNP